MPKAAKPLFVFSADWHLCRSAWANRAIFGDAYHALTAVVDICIELDVPLLAGGDLFDTANPHPDDVAHARSEMDRMQEAGLGVFFCMGQHERVVDVLAGESAGHPWLSSIHQWPMHLPSDQDAIRLGDFRIAALDYTPPGLLPEALARVAPDVDYLLSHQVWSEIAGGKGHPDAKIGDIPAKYDVLSGDYHKHKTVACNGPDGPGTRVAYSPGAIHRLAIDEPDEHFVFVFHDDKNVTSRQLPSRYAGRYVLDTVGAFDEFLRDDIGFFFEDAAHHFAKYKLHPDLRKPLLRVKYRDDIPDARERLRKAVGDQAHLFDQAITAEEAVAAADGEPVEALPATGLVEGLASYDLSKAAAEHGVDADALREDVRRLLSSPASAAASVAELVREKLGE